MVWAPEANKLFLPV